jgi:hypothetical protein
LHQAFFFIRLLGFDALKGLQQALGLGCFTLSAAQQRKLIESCCVLGLDL